MFDCKWSHYSARSDTDTPAWLRRQPKGLLWLTGLVHAPHRLKASRNLGSNPARALYGIHSLSLPTLPVLSHTIAIIHFKRQKCHQKYIFKNRKGVSHLLNDVKFHTVGLINFCNNQATKIPNDLDFVTVKTFR